VKATQGERTVTDSHDAEFVLNPDGPEPAPGFSQQLVGLVAGQERSFTLNTAQQPEGEAPGTVDFTVRLHWVKEKELPALDDEFARTVGERDSVERLREEIRDQIRNRKEQQARERQREAILQAAIDQARIEAPPQAIEREANRLLNSMAASLDKQGISIEQYLQFTGKDESQFKSELLSQADGTLKRSLVLEAIAHAEGLEVNEAEVREEIELASQGANDQARTAREALQRPETRARIESIFRTRKGLERLVELGGGTPTEPSAVAVAEVPERTESNV
jgi:trigger factor